ncbi:hypothetical protein Tco_0472973 [Tanacetum coccineum]
MSSKYAEEEVTESDSENDYANLANSIVESSNKKKLKKFDFVTEGGEQFYFTAEKIKEQKRIEESLKADLSKQEVEKCKNELVDLMGIDVIKTRMDYLHQIEEELKIDFNKPLEEQDPLDELNDLANKKRKRADDFHDYFRSTKKFKSSVQYGDHPIDFEDFSNERLYTVHEVFFKFHQGPSLNDHARTFSSFVLAEVDKRNLNPLKKMRPIA